ncbi:enterocin immunity protein [Enterococcus faecium]|nr:enterocin immunity protein [Enterococcus faecium]
MNFKKNNLEYNLCIFLAVIINLGLFILVKSIILCKILYNVLPVSH